MHRMLSTALIGLVLPLSLGACQRWHAAPPAGHWEGGKTGFAEWQARGNRSLQNHITVIDNTQTHLPTVDANYELTAYNAVSHMLATARPAIPSHVENQAHGSATRDGNVDETLESTLNDDLVAGDVFDSSLPVLYSTTVDLNDFDKTTNFGRLMSEALATALTQHWKNKVIKTTLRQGSMPIVPRQGQFLLSRDLQELALDYNAGAVLLSTYSVALDKVYVTVELVNVHHNAVVASCMFDIPLGPRTLALLRGIEYPDAMKAVLKGEL